MAQIQFRSDDTTTWSESFGDGSDGALTISTNTTDSTTNTTCSGNSGSTTLTVGDSSGFVNGNLVLIHQSRNGGDGAGVWQLNKIQSGGGTTTWTMKYALTNNYVTTAQVYLLKQYSSVTVNSGITLTSSAWNGTKGGIVAFLCKGTITVTGKITTGGPGSGGGYSIAATGYRGNLAVSSQNGVQGEGTAGAGGTISTSANGNGGGGGGSQSSPNWHGGGGGYADAGGNGPNGSGGGIVGAAGAVTANGGHGGYGGGIIVLIGITITVTGQILADGTDGQVGGDANGGGGGGSGGSILFKGTNITLGTGLATAVGAAAGTNSAGAAGQGRIHADYQNSISGTTAPALDSRQDSSLSTTTSTSTSTTSTSTSRTTSTSTSTTVSVTTSTSTTSTSRSTSTTTTSTSTTSTSTSTTSTSTSTTSTSTTLDLKFTVEQG